MDVGVLLTGIAGLLIGSFLNVLIYRLPRNEDFIFGHSHCPHCGHDLGPADLVPVVSYLALGKRCRYCRAPISARYAIVEGTTAILFGTAWVLFGPSSLARFVLCAGLLSTGIVIFFIMVDRQKVPGALLWISGALCAGLFVLSCLRLGS